MAKNNIQIEIAYVTPQQQTLLSMVVPGAFTIRDAITQAQLPVEVNDELGVGIFGRQRSLDFQLQEGDRIEIYRPLFIEPKAARLVRIKRERRKKLTAERSQLNAAHFLG